MVVNLRYLNQFLRKDTFKYEDVHVASLVLRKNDYLFKFDLKSVWMFTQNTKGTWGLGGTTKALSMFCVYCAAIWPSHCMVLPTQIFGKVLEEQGPEGYLFR